MKATNLVGRHHQPEPDRHPVLLRHAFRQVGCEQLLQVAFLVLLALQRLQLALERLVSPRMQL